MSERTQKSESPVTHEKTPHGTIDFRTHPSDFTIDLRGHSAEDLFRLAAWALARVQAPTWPGDDGEEAVVDLLSDGWDDLLVNWIEELIALSERHRTLWTEVEFESIGENGVKARVRGKVWPEDGVDGGRVVKSASYHGLEVIPGPALWLGRVALDL